MRISGATALVTGASSGIGRQVALRLARAGATVVAHGRDVDALSSVGGRVVAVELAGPGAGERVAAAAGDVDILVNNAGIGWAGSFAEMPGASIEELITVNLAAPIALTRALLPGMVARGAGHLMFVTSIAGRTGVAGEAVYAATKAGLDVFAESLRFELAGTGVRVGVVVPGVVETAFFVRRGQPYTRRSPKPIPADVVAAAVVRGIATDRADRYAPGWLRLPVAVRAVLPGVYRRLGARFGGQ